MRLTTNIIVGIAVIDKLLAHYYNEQHPSSTLPLVFIHKVNVTYTHDSSICPEPADSLNPRIHIELQGVLRC